MIQAVLFDLDDTLLDNSNEQFLPAYFQAITQKLEPLIPADEFLKHLIFATRQAVVNVDSTRTNREVFWDNFTPAVGPALAEELRPLLEDFYANDFARLQEHTHRRPEARQVVQHAFDRGCDVVIATNPLYPRRAILHRLEWAGVADFPYALITSYENMHFTKPHPAYYREIAQRIRQAPADCLMVGDDLRNDIRPAAEAGMLTFWVTDQLHADHPAHWAGSLLDVGRLIGDGS